MPELTPLDAVSHLVGVDENAIPETAVVMVTHLRPDGTQAYRYAVYGEPDLAQILGMFRVIEDTLLHSHPTEAG
jgi:hypothetical protein